MLSHRRDLRYLLLAIFVVLLGLFNSGLDDSLANENTPPAVSTLRQPLVQAGYHFRQQTKEEQFYQCFGEMAFGRQHDRSFLQEHRGNLGRFESGMLGPETVVKPVLPYRDYMAEYPPVNFPFIAAPSLSGEKLDNYSASFRIMLGLLNVCALLLSCYLAVRYLGSAQKVRVFLLLSLAGTLLLGPIMVTRLDPIALFFFVGALVAVSKERPVLAGLSLALAVGAKIVPMFLIPFFFLHWWLNQERTKAIRLGISSVAGIGVIFLPALFAGPENFQALFRFHGQRPIQVESSYGVFLRLQEMIFNTPVELIHSYGSWNLSAPASGLMASLSTPLALATVAAMLWFYRGWLMDAPTADKESRECWLLRACGATVAGLMFFSKVFSPQYLIWMWPWIFLADRGKARSLHGVCLLAFFLTQLITQPYATAMVQGEVLGTLLLAARNLSLLAILILLARRPAEPERSDAKAKDWGPWSATIPFVLAILSLFVHLQSRSLESQWLEERPEFKKHIFVRAEFEANLQDKDLMLFRGYHGLEVQPDGRTFAWTEQPEVIHFMPSTAARADHLFEFEAINALDPDFEEGLKLSVNGEPVEVWSDNDGWPKHWTAWIPAPYLKSKGLNRLNLLTPTPVSPESLGVGPDYRALGLQMNSVSFVPVEGLVRFQSPPPKDVLKTFQLSRWVVRTLSKTRPDGEDWKKVEGDYWEAPSTATLGPSQEHPFWFYRPGQLTAGFEHLPLGPGWSEATADRAGRSLRRLREGDSGRLSLSVPAGRTVVTFSVLKSDIGESPSSVALSINGKPADLRAIESDWETSYQTEFQSEGGMTHFDFSDQTHFWQESPAFSHLTLAPAP